MTDKEKMLLLDATRRKQLYDDFPMEFDVVGTLNAWKRGMILESFDVSSALFTRVFCSFLKT